MLCLVVPNSGWSVRGPLTLPYAGNHCIPAFILPRQEVYILPAGAFYRYLRSLDCFTLIDLHPPFMHACSPPQARCLRPDHAGPRQGRGGGAAVRGLQRRRENHRGENAMHRLREGPRGDVHGAWVPGRQGGYLRVIFVYNWFIRVACSADSVTCVVWIRLHA